LSILRLQCMINGVTRSSAPWGELRLQRPLGQQWFDFPRFMEVEKHKELSTKVRRNTRKLMTELQAYTELSPMI